jgi:hypothetical protein
MNFPYLKLDRRDKTIRGTGNEKGAMLRHRSLFLRHSNMRKTVFHPKGLIFVV